MLEHFYVYKSMLCICMCVCASLPPHLSFPFSFKLRFFSFPFRSEKWKVLLYVVICRTCGCSMAMKCQSIDRMKTHCKSWGKNKSFKCIKICDWKINLKIEYKPKAIAWQSGMRERNEVSINIVSPYRRTPYENSYQSEWIAMLYDVEWILQAYRFEQNQTEREKKNSHFTYI